jgi:hypothetical protein
MYNFILQAIVFWIVNQNTHSLTLSILAVIFCNFFTQIVLPLGFTAIAVTLNNFIRTDNEA